MGTAKEIIIKVLPSKIANDFVKKHHYSGKVVNNSQLHFGCFLNGVLHGVMSFGCPMDKRKVLGLVVDKDGKPALWNEMLELNRMAFDEVLPRNSESRCIAIALKLIKKKAPHIRWVLSFADGTQCGDGAIYRASGFKLTALRKNTTIKTDGERIIADITITAHKPNEISNFRKNFKPLDGYMLRYINILDKNYHLAVPEIPFSKIDEIGAGMYKGERITIKERKEALR